VSVTTRESGGGRQDTHMGDVCRRDWTEQFDAILQLILLPHLLQLNHLGSVAPDHKAYLRVQVANMRCRCDEQVDPFAVDQAGHDDDGHWSQV
jgi:hypothetical protein